LNKDYYVHVLAVDKSGEEQAFTKLNKVKLFHDVFRIILIKLGLYQCYYWDKFKKQAVHDLKDDKFDLVIAHEIRLLPLALRVSKGAEVILDAHEYSPKNFDDDFLWRLFIKRYYTWLCKTYLPKIQTLFSVSQGIVDEYEKVFGVESILLTNACEYYDLNPTPVNDKIKIIHHGIASPSRKLELMIEVMKHTDSRFELYLMLVHTKFTERYVKKLRSLAKNMDNVFFIGPVSKHDLVSFTNRFDIGMIFVPPFNFNLQHGLPNKFFEMVQSRMAVACGPFIEISPYIKKYNLGIISKTWEPKSMAIALNELSNEDVYRLKMNAHNSAMEISSEKETEKFLNIIKRYL